jgi:hypothetical protein
MLRSSAETGSAIEVEHVSDLLSIDEAENLIRELSERPGVLHAHIRRDLLVSATSHRGDPIPV